MTTETPVKGNPGIYKRAGRKPYCVRYREEGASRRKSFRTLEEAKSFRRDTEAAQKLTGHFVSVTDREMTMNRWLDDEYLPAMSLVWSHGTAENAKRVIDAHIRPTFGSMRLAAISQADVQRWVVALAAPDEDGERRLPSTVNNYYKRLRAVLMPAVGRIIPASPCNRNVKRPTMSDNAVTSVLSPQMVVGIARVVDPRIECAVWIGAMAGLRIGEVLGLTIDMIDFDKGVIHVRQQWKASDGGHDFGETKTRKHRSVPVSADLLAKIKLHVATFGLSSRRTLFAGNNGEPMTTRRLYALWKPVYDLGLTDRLDKFHALRHHYASVLIEAGENVKVIQTRLGHSTVALTLNTYGHLFPTADDRTRDAFTGLYDSHLAVA